MTTNDDIFRAESAGFVGFQGLAAELNDELAVKTARNRLETRQNGLKRRNLPSFLRDAHARAQHFLNLAPLPQGQGALRPTLSDGNPRSFSRAQAISAVGSWRRCNWCAMKRMYGRVWVKKR